MSELQIIQLTLARAARRRRWQRALDGLGRGLLAGAVLILVALTVYKLFPIPAWMVPASALLALGAMLAGWIHGAWRKPSLLETARWVDERRQLRERLSTALEMAGTPLAEDWKQLLVTDAAQHARSLKPKELLPIRFPGVGRVALLGLAVCVGLGFVPEYRTGAQRQKAQEAANIKDVGRNLAELVRHELAQKPPALPPAQKSIEQVAELGERFGKQALTRGEALRDLTSVTEQLARQQRDLASNPALKALERSAREPGNTANPSAQSLQKQIDALQKSLGNAAADADKLDKLSRQLDALKQQAAALASKDPQAGAAAREQLAQNLADLAGQTREAGASLENLEQAIQALASNNTDLFLKDLENATQDLEKMRDLAKAMQQLQEQAASLGKNLAEQLEKGQGQAAIQTLQKMVDQLKSGGLSKEDLQQIIDEAQKAVKAGSQYGSVGDLLKKAAQRASAGDRSQAAENLAEAQAELQKLMDQMADAQALQATLDALARAQMAISQCKSWSQCQGRPGFKPGGKPGRGVGTWADEYGWTYFPENQEGGWDNSSVQRPDFDPKGHTDRPDDLNPNLVPDKVKGQLSPGGSMPSITLKGVSVKGTSNIKFEEAATSAQADAQSALNQDQVPRAYQNAVRDYFDDLKK